MPATKLYCRYETGSGSVNTLNHNYVVATYGVYCWRLCSSRSVSHRKLLLFSGNFCKTLAVSTSLLLSIIVVAQSVPIVGSGASEIRVVLQRVDATAAVVVFNI
jgi:hypothetical protein